MAKYFMSGTKYEKYERMMMSPDRSPGYDHPQRKKILPFKKPAKEKWQGK